MTRHDADRHGADRDRGARREADAVLGSILDPNGRGALFPLYHRLRDLDPVHVTDRFGMSGCVVLSRHRDIDAVMHDPRNYKDDRMARLYGATGDGPFDQMMRGLLPNTGPDAHAHQRGLLAKAFTPRAAGRLEQRVVEVADELLDEMAASGGEAELVAAYAYQLPVTVICELLGVPSGDRVLFREASRAFALAGDVAAGPEARRGGDDAAARFDAYLRELIAARRAEPDDGLLSHMIRAEHDGAVLSDDELVTLSFTLLSAGHDTTANLLATGLWALFTHPDQLERLRGDASLTADAVEELVRFDGPVQITTYVLGADTTFDTADGPVTVPGETPAVLLIGAGNRDPARFDEPDRLDIARADPGHLGFGYGPYYCLGASLARTEARVGLRRLLDRFPGLEPATSTVTYRPSLAMHGLEALPVRW